MLDTRGDSFGVFTPAGKLLYPGLQTGFARIQEAVAGLGLAGDDRVLVISTPPGFTAKWLAPRLYRFAAAHPEIDVRVSSSFGFANFTTDGVDVAIRNMPVEAANEPALVVERLVDLSLVPVCSPRLIKTHGSLAKAEALARVPLIHDDSFVRHPEAPTWADWFKAAGVKGIVLVEHDMDLVAAYSHRIVALAEGRVLADLPPDRFFADPTLIATVIGKRREH